VLPFPVIFAPYLRTQDYPPSGAALDPSLSFSQPVNLQMRIVHPGYFCGTLQPSTYFGLHSFVVFCIKSFHNCFTISRFRTLSQIAGCHPTIPILELVTRHQTLLPSSFSSHTYKCPLPQPL
jgi:hypothetical protein